ncbi:SMP-30/Gluconolaconase/LRE-like region [Colletotrichum karsti]|uniref:SMP-30/Gluconolaconase/LRE-like region n=1 Tax=Colletotrichum karsti TaxID=1095194 RepID=A0A9P6I2J9_9PEZI|nr:SMP-30/Gluconolaconase/LRE-like region [Colletotrichum karsti]KAF9870760.1 SMP-30/Gluconolaconase/LRE-like region [Colletotrichum karsti]
MANNSPFAVYDDSVSKLFGEEPTLELLHENQEYPFAHEAGVFIESNNTLFITSNQFPDGKGGKKIQICRVTLPSDDNPTLKCEEIHPRGVHMANGGVNYLDGVLFCSQGSLDAPGGIVFMEAHPPYQTRVMVSSFHGREFNSVNDVVVDSDGSIWFTDPIYGFEQGIRPRPKLPSQVYNPDEKTVYVTDTDWIHGDGTTDLTRASTIYAFDVVSYSGEPFLTNRRLFAMADTGIPDGIKCDVHGNVYSGCGDGINIWSAGGVLLGKILVQGGAANFCFGRNGEIFILNENRLWRAKLAEETKGALLCI